MWIFDRMLGIVATDELLLRISKITIRISFLFTHNLPVSFYHTFQELLK